MILNNATMHFAALAQVRAELTLRTRLPQSHVAVVQDTMTGLTTR